MKSAETTIPQASEDIHSGDEINVNGVRRTVERVEYMSDDTVQLYCGSVSFNFHKTQAVRLVI